MTRIRHVLLAALICTLAAGCGEDSDRSATPATPTAVTNLERFLLQKDEIPGFKPREAPRIDSSAASVAGQTGNEELLRKSGFITLTFQPMDSDNGNGGVASVLLFKSEAGARDWMAYETSDESLAFQLPDIKIKRFKAADPPGANGFTSLDVHGNRIGQIYWVQGRCMMTIGNEGKGPFPEPLATGAMAIYERTNGDCPA